MGTRAFFVMGQDDVHEGCRVGFVRANLSKMDQGLDIKGVMNVELFE